MIACIVFPAGVPQYALFGFLQENRQKTARNSIKTPRNNVSILDVLDLFAEARYASSIKYFIQDMTSLFL